MMTGIFENDDERMANINSSAEKLGLKAKPKETQTKPTKQPMLRAKKSCKSCWGRGTLVFQAPGAIIQSLIYCRCVKKVEIE